MTATNPPADYRVSIVIGTSPQVSYDVDSDAAYDGTDPEQVLDGLTIGWAFPSGAPWPSQPDPSYATIRLLALDVATLADIAVEGAPVEVQVQDAPGGTGNTIASFYGRIAAATAAPVKRPSGPRTLFTLSCVDYTVDLAETTIDLDARAAESTGGRLTAISNAIELVTGSPIGGLPVGGGELDAASARTTDALSALSDVLRQINESSGFRRYFVWPSAGGNPPTTLSFGIENYENEIDSVELPGLLEMVAGILYLTFPATIGGDQTKGIVDGCRVNLDSVTWRNAKKRSVSRVTVTGPFGSVLASSGSDRVVKLELASTYTGADIDPLDPLDSAVGRMALMYLPDTSETNGWEAVSFRFMASDLLAQIREMFPEHATSAVFSQWPIGPVVVTDVPDPINLAGPTGLYAGQLHSATLTVANRHVDVEFTLRRMLPDPIGNQAKTASYDYVEATFFTASASYQTTVQLKGPLGYWRFNETTGTTFFDSSGHSRNGVHVNGPTLGQTGLLTGDTDLCVYYPGTNDHSDVAPTGGFLDGLTAFTVTAMIRPDITTGIQNIVSRDGSPGRSFQFRLNGQLLEFVKITGTVVTAASAAGAIVANTTYHVAAVYDGTDIRIYKNGALTGTPAAATGDLGTMARGIMIGASRNSSTDALATFFQGKIDEPAIYSHALTAAEIAADYAAATGAATLVDYDHVDPSLTYYDTRLARKA